MTNFFSLEPGVECSTVWVVQLSIDVFSLWYPPLSNFNDLTSHALLFYIMYVIVRELRT